MKLSKEITLKQYPFKDYKGILKNPEPFIISPPPDKVSI